MSRYSRNRKRLRQVEGRRAVIETILSDKKISHIDMSKKTEGSQIDQIIKLASQKKIKINFVDKKSIEKKYQELESKKIVPDEELIKKFPDEIFVPVDVTEGSVNRRFNSILSRLSKKAKKSILT